MKCTWKNCTAAAVHEQIDRDGNVWACLCQAHHDQLYFTVEGLVRSELKLDKFLGVNKVLAAHAMAKHDSCMHRLTPLQQQAYNLRQQGLKIREICRIMKRTPENVRQLVARAEGKIRRGATSNE